MTFLRGDIILEKLGQAKEENIQLDLEAKRQAMLAELKSVPPFPESERTMSAKKHRIDLCRRSYWDFEAIYFPPELYEGYAEPGRFHKVLVQIAELHDRKAHVIHGPRDHAKTATLKKKFVYDFLFGWRRYMAIGSETLDTPVSAIKDIREFLQSNDRILFDFDIEWLEESEEKLFAKSIVNPRGTYVDALSADRSARGKQRAFFQRLDYIYLTDFENLTSSVTREAIEKRIDRLNEMRTSLSEGGTLLWEGNNFDPDCAMNHLFTEEERGILSDQIVMHHFPAWVDKAFTVAIGESKTQIPKGPLWPERNAATTEEGIKKLLGPKDGYDWSGNFQGRPKKRSGEMFPEEFYNEWDELPEDLKCVIWVDPNCSLKDKGDTTAISCFGFSVSRQKYYIPSARCLSYSDPNELLKDTLRLRAAEKARNISVIALGFDGNVKEESTWTNNILNYSRINKIPFPYVEFRRYKVDDLSKNAEGEYKAGKFLFPPGFRKTQEGKRFTDQFFAFRSKKAKRKDDAPDSIISALELLQELGIVGLVGGPPKIHKVPISRRNLTDRF